MKKGLKPIHIITKTMTQIFILMFEVCGIGILFSFLCNKFYPTDNSMEHISRFLMGSSLYEIIIFLTLTQLNDIKKDAYLALLTAYKTAELICSCNSIELQEHLNEKIDYQLDGGTFNSIEIRNEYEILKKVLQERDIVNIRYKIILFEHLYEYTSLQWRYSILLRLKK